MSATQVLNSTGGNSKGVSLPADQLSVALQRHMLSMKGEFLSEDGRGVNYMELSKSDTFKSYVETAGELRGVDLTACTEQQRKAFFINIYNALTIHGLVASPSLPGSVLELKGFWRNTCYNISGHVYSLDDIEHGLLRANRPHPSSPEPLLKDGDPRLQFVMSDLDPRIHFALVCGAKSCPAIQVFSAEKLHRGLEIAARSFCSQEVSVDVETSTVSLSQIFQWYAVDFGHSTSDILRWLQPYLPEEKAGDLEKVLNKTAQVSLQYTKYNWLLNKL